VIQKKSKTKFLRSVVINVSDCATAASMNIDKHHLFAIAGYGGRAKAGDSERAADDDLGTCTVGENVVGNYIVDDSGMRPVGGHVVGDYAVGDYGTCTVGENAVGNYTVDDNGMRPAGVHVVDDCGVAVVLDDCDRDSDDARLVAGKAEG
jgi:hypothetical protein